MPCSFDRLRVFEHHRRVGEVRARHHQRVDVRAKQQDMQRRIGQHHAEIAVFAQMLQARRALSQQHDGLVKARQHPPLRLRQNTELCRAVRIPAHEGEGLLVPLLAAAKPLGDLRLIRPTGQMDAAEALDRHDFSRRQRLLGKRNRVPLHALSFAVQEKDPRAADRAAVRLRVIAPVRDIAVFPLAVGAHGKALHGGLGPVVGQIADDRKARAAVGAVDEGIAIAPVFGVIQLPQAVLTHADVRRNERVPPGLRPAA